MIFYRICYSWKDLSDWPCDETQRPTRGVWHDESVDIFEKFATRYRKEDVVTPRNVRFQFVFSSGSPYGADQDIEIHFDDIKVGGATSYETAGAKGCGKITLKSNTEVTTGTKGMSMAIDGVDIMSTPNIFNPGTFTNGFCYIIVERLTKPSAKSQSDIICINPSALMNTVENMNDGDRILLVSFGANVTCALADECPKALELLGGISVQWPLGSSLAFAGRKGAAGGTMPMSLELLNEGIVSTDPTFFCSDIVTALSETTAQGGVIGPPMARLNPDEAIDARFEMMTKPSGYLGCFRGVGCAFPSVLGRVSLQLRLYFAHILFLYGGVPALL
jgi:hypothetical protein